MKLQNIKTKQDFDHYFLNEIWNEAAKQICLRNHICFNELKRANSSDHIVFLLDDKLVLKIYRPFRRCFDREKKALEFVGEQISLKVPEIIQIGEFEQFEYIITNQISGELLTRQDWLLFSEKEQHDFISKLAVGMKEIHQLNADSLENNWAEFVRERAETFIERQIAHGVNQQIIEVLPKFIEENLKLVSTGSVAVFMHSDIHFGNMRVAKINGKWEIAGLFDFADSRCGFYEYDFLAVGVLMIQGQKEIQRQFFKAYGYAEKDLD